MSKALRLKSSSARIAWLDIVKYICIMMVIVTHLESSTKVFAQFYAPFFLTAFFFCSGYVHKNKYDFGSFLYRKFRQLFIPWLVFSVFNILLSHVISFNSHSSLMDELLWNFAQIRGHGDELWFIAALFVAYIPFYYVIAAFERFKKCKYALAVTLVTVMLLSVISVCFVRFFPGEAFPWEYKAIGSDSFKSAVLPWHIEYVFQAILFMTLGYFFRSSWEKHFDRINNPAFCIFIFTLFLASVYIPYIALHELPAAADIPYNYAVSFIGIAMVISVSKKLPANMYVNYIGQNTLICFAFHGKVMSILQMVFRKIASGTYAKILSSDLYSTIFSLILAVVISFVLIIPAYIINRWLPFLIGRNIRTPKYVRKQSRIGDNI